MSLRALLIAVSLAIAVPSSAEEVDVELFLAVDVSRSMSYDELELQRQGYASALTSPEVMQAIESGLLGVIAVTYVEWAGAGSQKVIVPWTRLATPDDATRIADTITAHFENALRRTSISSALLYAEKSISTNDFNGLRRVIDVSGDGPNNMGPPVDQTRDFVLAQGVVINGLPLMTQDGSSDRWGISDLDAYYANCVTGGPGSFVIPVLDWAEFLPALRRKLVLEIASPAAIAPPAARIRPAQAYDCLVGEKIWRDNMENGWREP